MSCAVPAGLVTAADAVAAAGATRRFTRIVDAAGVPSVQATTTPCASGAITGYSVGPSDARRVGAPKRTEPPARSATLNAAVRTPSIDSSHAANSWPVPSTATSNRDGLRPPSVGMRTRAANPPGARIGA